MNLNFKCLIVGLWFTLGCPISQASESSCRVLLERPTLPYQEAQAWIHKALRTHPVYNDLNLVFLRRFEEALIRQIDPFRIVFSQEDIDAISMEFSKNPSQLANEIEFKAPLNLIQVVQRRAIFNIDRIRDHIALDPDLKSQVLMATPAHVQDLPFAQSEKERLDRTVILLAMNTRGQFARSTRSEDDSFALAFRWLTRELNIWSANLDIGFINELILKSFVGALDPHSKIESPTYQPAERKYSLGFGVAEQANGFSIEALGPASPAESAGILKGDILTHVGINDGKSPWIALRGRTAVAVTEMFTSGFFPHSKIRLRLLRDGQNHYVLLDRGAALTGQGVLAPKYGRLVSTNKGVLAYIRISRFVFGLSEIIAKEILDLQSKGARGVVLDLRGVTGGFEFERFLNLFIHSGVLVRYLANKEANLENEVYATADHFAYGGPLVVLVDEASASASEMVALGIQDHSRGIIVGTRTHGKGSVQESFPVTYENGLKGKATLTTGFFLSPRGHSPQLVGVKPDIPLGQVKKADRLEDALPGALTTPTLGSPHQITKAGNLTAEIIRSLRYLSRQRTTGSTANFPNVVDGQDGISEAIRVLEDLIQLLAAQPL